MRSITLGAAIAVLATAAWAADPKTDDTSKSNSNSNNQVYQLGSTDSTGGKQQLGKSGDASAKDLQQIKDLANSVAKAFSSNDPQAAANLFAEDASVINPQGKRADGRDQIQQQFTNDLNGPMKDQQFTFSNIEVKMIKPDVAYFDLDQLTQGGKQNEAQQGQGGPPPRVHVTGLVVKQGGKWVIEEARPATYLKEQPTSSS